MLKLRLLSLTGVFLTVSAAGAERLAEHVVVIGLDGCRPEAIQQAAGPVLKELWQTGACHWQAQAAEPSVTHVNFAGILTSCQPEKHGIAEKEWVKGIRPPKVQVPTVFDVVSGAGLKAAGFLGHEKLYPSETGAAGVHIEHSPYQAKSVAPLAAKYLKEHKPNFCFIYMGDLDGAGHKHGWLSAEQLAVMPSIDEALHDIVTALRESGMWEKTLLIITADHGGHDRSHSAGTPEDRTVPWIATGPLMRQGEIQGEVHNWDTAATAVWALGLAPPEIWDGKPVPLPLPAR